MNPVINIVSNSIIILAGIACLYTSIHNIRAPKTDVKAVITKLDKETVIRKGQVIVKKCSANIRYEVNGKKFHSRMDLPKDKWNLQKGDTFEITVGLNNPEEQFKEKPVNMLVSGIILLVIGASLILLSI